MPGCFKCGLCCKAILLSVGMEEIKKDAENCKRRGWQNRDAVFISENWEQMSMEEALQINPFLSVWLIYGTRYAYRCKKLGKDNLCTVHEDRPAVCYRFPYYGRNSVDGMLPYTLQCGYFADGIVNADKLI